MVVIMPNRSRNFTDEANRSGSAGASASVNPGQPESVGSPGPERNNSSETNHHDIPRWRQIEIMRERAQLREALGDLDLDAEDVEEEVFGSEEENEALYIHDDNPADADIDLPGDETLVDEFSEFEDD
jgi:hypothetical protein